MILLLLLLGTIVTANGTRSGSDYPKCDTEHYYNPNTDTCVTKCDNLGEDFTVYKNLALWNNNHEILTNIRTLPDCITRCLAGSYITLSIDFSADERKCICATKSPGMAGMRTFTPVESYVLAVRQCANDGSWGSWNGWTGCSVTCGTGTWTRQRACDYPIPNNRGRACQGSADDSASCNTGVECSNCQGGPSPTCTVDECRVDVNGKCWSLKVLDTISGDISEASRQCRAKYGSEAQLPEAADQSDLNTIYKLSQSGPSEAKQIVWVGARKGSGNSWMWPSGTPVFKRMNNGPCSVVKFGGGRALLKDKPCTADAGWERNVVCSIPIEA